MLCPTHNDKKKSNITQFCIAKPSGNRHIDPKTATYNSMADFGVCGVRSTIATWSEHTRLMSSMTNVKMTVIGQLWKMLLSLYIHRVQGFVWCFLRNDREQVGWGGRRMENFAAWHTCTRCIARLNTAVERHYPKVRSYLSRDVPARSGPL